MKEKDQSQNGTDRYADEQTNQGMKRRARRKKKAELKYFKKILDSKTK